MFCPLPVPRRLPTAPRSFAIDSTRFNRLLSPPRTSYIDHGQGNAATGVEEARTLYSCRNSRSPSLFFHPSHPPVLAPSLSLSLSLSRLVLRSSCPFFVLAILSPRHDEAQNGCRPESARRTAVKFINCEFPPRSHPEIVEPSSVQQLSDRDGTSPLRKPAEHPPSVPPPPHARTT